MHFLLYRKKKFRLYAINNSNDLVLAQSIISFNEDLKSNDLIGVYSKLITIEKKDYLFQEEIGKRLLSCLIDLGPGYIKFGQALSTRPDLVDKRTCQYLKKLQDDIEPFSSSIAKKIILI